MAGNRKVLIKKETRDIPVNVWHPNDSYKLTLQEIREQLTPAGIYRHKLATTGKAERVLRRLEWRWERRLQKWTKAATTVQAGYRGMIGRRYFKTIRIELEIKKAQREAKIAAIEAFKAGDREKTIEILSMVEQMTGELYIVKAKVLYTLGQFEDSIECALAALSTPSMEYDARFILANCYTRKNQMLSAFDQLNLLAIAGDRRTDSRRLLAYVATRLDPPNYDESISVLDTLIDDFPEDMNLLLQRASVFCCMQNYRKAIMDYSNILYYQKDLEMVLLLRYHFYVAPSSTTNKTRARAYSCNRKWKKAEEDYREVLVINPLSEDAKLGLQEILQPILELPMIAEDELDV